MPQTNAQRPAYLRDIAGGPSVDLAWAWPLLGVSWVAGLVLARFRYR